MDRGVYQCTSPAATVNGERSLPVHFTSCILHYQHEHRGLTVHHTCCNSERRKESTSALYQLHTTYTISTSALYLLHVMYTNSMDRVYTHEQWREKGVYQCAAYCVHYQHGQISLPVHITCCNSEWRMESTSVLYQLLITLSAWTEGSTSAPYLLQQ